MRTVRFQARLDSYRVQERNFEVISPAPRDAWSEILPLDSRSLVSQSPAWLDCLCKTLGYEDASRYYEFGGGQRVILPLARRSYLGILRIAASFQNGWGMGGLVSSRPLATEEMQVVVEDLSRSEVLHTVIRPDPLKAQDWMNLRMRQALAIPRLAHVLDLKGGFNDVWQKKFKGVTRTAIRKAEKSGVFIERDTTGRLFPVYYELFRQSLERWGENQHEPLPLTRWRGTRRDPISKFNNWVKFLGEACRIWVAYVNQQPAAAIIVLQENNASYTRGVMNKSLAGPVRANDLLHFLAIREACEAGCHYYHMGESGKSASLAAFKSNFGAEPIPYSEYHFQRLPLIQIDRWARSMIKRTIRFQDA